MFFYKKKINFYQILLPDADICICCANICCFSHDELKSIVKIITIKYDQLYFYNLCICFNCKTKNKKVIILMTNHNIFTWNSQNNFQSTNNMNQIMFQKY